MRKKRKHREDTLNDIDIIYAKNALYDKGVSDALLHALSRGRRKGQEIAFFVDVKTGKRAFPSVNGTEKSVTLTSEASNFLKNAPFRSVTLIHNHPSGGAFSASDLSVMCKYKSLESIRVIGHNGIQYYASVKTGGQRPSKEQLKNDYEKKVDRQVKMYRPKVVSGKISADDAAMEVYHNVNEQLAKDYGWVYVRRLPK